MQICSTLVQQHLIMAMPMQCGMMRKLLCRWLLRV
jgi:hypothetical protein